MRRIHSKLRLPPGCVRRLAGVAVLSLLLAGCSGPQDALSPKSRQARDIANLFWVMLGVAAIGLAAVVTLLLLSWMRARRRRLGTDAVLGKPGERGAWYVVVGAGIALPVVLISALFIVADVFLIRTTQAPAASSTRLTILVIGHEWWWEVRYPGTDAVTADEIHMPARTPVRLEVRTADVIHSFWVPELNRKIDTIPGQTNSIELYAERPGRFRGTCAEFCGLEHARMGIEVIAQEPSAFRSWLAAQAAPAQPPASGTASQGEALFASAGCASCHTIRGTDASGDVGPDLTHLMRRATLAALTIPNTQAELRAWITGSQHLKPGNQMPDNDIRDPQLASLVAYLEHLR